MIQALALAIGMLILSPILIPVGIIRMSYDDFEMKHSTCRCGRPTNERCVCGGLMCDMPSCSGSCSCM